MPRQPRVTSSEVLRELRRDGWSEVRQVGSHVHLSHPTKSGRVTVPVHRGEILAPKTFASIMSQAGISIDRTRGLS